MFFRDVYYILYGKKWVNNNNKQTNNMPKWIFETFQNLIKFTDFFCIGQNKRNEIN